MAKDELLEDEAPASMVFPRPTSSAIKEVPGHVERTDKRLKLVGLEIDTGAVGSLDIS